MRNIFESTLERLLADLVTPSLLRECEAGVWPTALWDALQESGFTVSAAPEALGGAGAGWDDLYVVVRAAGRFSLPVPLPETMLANALLAACGFEARNAVLSFAPRAELVIQDSRVSGVLRDMPWGRHATQVVAVVEGDLPTVVLLDPRHARITVKMNTAGEPRDDLHFDVAMPLEQAPLPAGMPVDVLWLGGAMLRAGQAAGALEATLKHSVQYATERVQFGKPIAAFQAIQHQLAVMAEQSGCAGVAAENAFAASLEASSPLAVATAKICAAEASGVVAGMAHAIHGAIGFTHEHALQHLTRRVWSWRSEFGNLGHWSERLGRAVCRDGSLGLWPAITSGKLDLPARTLSRTDPRTPA